jgi:hypothetical protein
VAALGTDRPGPLSGAETYASSAGEYGPTRAATAA